jgi:hypothetical protein
LDKKGITATNKKTIEGSKKPAKEIAKLVKKK